MTTPAGPRWRRAFLAALVLLALGLLAAGGGVAWLWQRTAPANASRVEVAVPRGASIRTVARELHRAGLVGSPQLFELLARSIGGGRAVHFGVYEFARGEGWGRLLAKLQAGDTLVLDVVIPEGMPSIMVAERLNAAPRLVGKVDVPAEGSVFPATYGTSVGEDRGRLLAEMQRKMAHELDRLWAARAPGLVVKSKAEAIVLASIVEKETAVASERRRIAGLYANRLRLGMPLQADPTVIYPVTRGKPLARRILRSELESDSPYNTYRHAGLPPGPITNPGRASIEAVLHPEANDFLYMVADGRGGHVFARDYASHQANVARWRAHRAATGR